MADGALGRAAEDSTMRIIGELERELESARGGRRIDVLVELSGYVARVEPDRARELVHAALELARESRDELRTGRALQALALVDLDRVGPAEVVRHLLAARRIFLRCDSLPDLADVHRHLVLVYAQTGTFKEAEAALAEARRLHDLRDDPEALAKLENNAGIFESVRSAPDAARECFQRALEIAEREGIPTIQQSSRNNLGFLELQQGLAEEAFRHFEEALDASRRLGTKQGMAAARVNGGSALRALGRTAEAREWLEEGTALAAELGLRSFERSGHNMLAALEQEEGNIEAAFGHLERYAKITSEFLIETERESIPRAKAKDDAIRAEERFRGAQRMEILARVAGGAAHDFNNVLTAILGAIDIASRAPDAEMQKTAMELARTAVQQGRGLTGRLLSFARPKERGAESVNPNEAIGEIEGLARALLPATIEVRLDLAPDVPTLPLDPTSLEQVIMNLLINARDAMPEGGTIEIRTEAREGEVTLSVGDTGTGMDEETAARVFDAFFTTKPAGKGSGLGLYTVKDIVEECGGRIRLETSPGQGTTFHLSFPSIPPAD